jgi:hypothetical protein
LVDPDSEATTYHFDWGETTAYGQRIPGADASVGSGSSQFALTQVLTGLLPGTVYHYRLVASNCSGCLVGTSDGEDMSFTTESATSPGQATGPVTPKAQPPALGRTALVGVVSGVVLVRTPGSSVLRPLSANLDLPVGSLIDASRGIVEVTTALNSSGGSQSASAWDGSFVIGQSVSQRGMTTFTLPAPSGCPARAHASRLLAVSARASKKKPPPSLWAKDNHGEYSTRGQNSVATVRGTIWETVNGCNGTLTFVKKGLVNVRDLRRHRTILIRAGHRYLARS